MGAEPSTVKKKKVHLHEWEKYKCIESYVGCKAIAKQKMTEKIIITIPETDTGMLMRGLGLILLIWETE